MVLTPHFLMPTHHPDEAEQLKYLESLFDRSQSIGNQKEYLYYRVIEAEFPMGESDVKATVLNFCLHDLYKVTAIFWAGTKENTKSANDMWQLISPNATTDGNGTVTQAGTGESRLLLNLIVQLTNSQAGKAIPVDALWMNDAQVLALKFYYHLASLHVLVQPVEVVMPPWPATMSASSGRRLLRFEIHLGGGAECRLAGRSSLDS